MGTVTLERVQNKFACIIGELCSEPVVLSQFAIWLDLRLAEYKAKGAISLECSGDEPDPTWLKGHSGPQVRHKRREMVPGMPPSPMRDKLTQPIGHVTHISEQAQSRLSPDVVVVKEEPSDSMDVFPVTLHRHGNTSPNRTPMRKREHHLSPSDANLFSSSTSSAKLRRLTSTSNTNEFNTDNLTLEPVTNQSLMSIISGDLNDDHTISTLSESGISDYNNSQGDNSAQPTVSTSGMIIDPLGGVSETDSQSTGVRTDNGQTRTSVAAGTRMLPDDDVDITSVTILTAQALSEQGEPAESEQASKLCPDPRSDLYPSVYPERYSAKAIRARIDVTPQKPQNTIEHMTRVVSTLERWMWSKYAESRSVEQIPPSELDTYLVEFFTILSKPSGGNYEVKSFRKYRSSLERFLNENGYPQSITTSLLFAQSRAAFEYRKKNVNS